YGMVLVLPFTTPLAITWLWGFGPTLGKIPEAGLVPPGAGCEWHAPHESKLNRGPRPGLSPVTVWCSLNCASPVWKKAKSFALAVTEASGWPAFTPVSLRTPGSVWANIISGNRNAASNAKTHANLLAFISHPPKNGKAVGPGMLLVTFLHSPLPFLMIEPEKRAGLTGPGLSGLGTLAAGEARHRRE